MIIMINGEKACNQCMVQSQPITTITNKKQHTHTHRTTTMTTNAPSSRPVLALWEQNVQARDVHVHIGLVVSVMRLL